MSWILNAGGVLMDPPDGADTRHYINGIEYNGTAIELIHTEEGIARRHGTSYRYE